MLYPIIEYEGPSHEPWRYKIQTALDIDSFMTDLTPHSCILWKFYDAEKKLIYNRVTFLTRLDSGLFKYGCVFRDEDDCIIFGFSDVNCFETASYLGYEVMRNEMTRLNDQSLTEQVETLRSDVNRLQELVEKLWYAPNMPGTIDSSDHFIRMTTENVSTDT